MANFVSPGVYTIEKDISDYTPSINSSIVGIVGFASKGPTNKATLITSQNSLITTFGAPSEGLVGQGLEGSLEILEQTNSLYFVRAASSDAADASALMTMGTCPAVIVSGSRDAGEGYGVQTALTLRIQVYDNAGAAQYSDNSDLGRDFSVPAGTATYQGEALRKIIGGGMDADHVGVFTDNLLSTGLGLSGAIVGSYAGSGASIGVSACTGTSFEASNGVSALLVPNPSAIGAADFGTLTHEYGLSGAASAVRAYGTSFMNTGGGSVAYAVESLHPGAGYNGGSRTNGDTSGNSITVANLGGANFNLNVNDQGTTSENFKGSFVASGAFIEQVINTGATNTTSNTIKGNIVSANVDLSPTALDSFAGAVASLVPGSEVSCTWDYLTSKNNGTGTGTPVRVVAGAVGSMINPRFIKLVAESAKDLAGGDNGVATGAGSEATNATALIGSTALDPKTGMQALDDNVLNIGIALVPGVQTQSVQNNLITLAERTQNFIALVSPPYGIGTVQDAIDWSNGMSSSTAGSRTAAINSSYAAIYWPWVQVFSVFDAKDRWFDPSIYGARQMAYTDSVADSWFAPAGFRRGRLTKPTQVEVKLNQGDRDSMYSGGNVVNPIVNFPQQGITIFGQRTTQRSPTALDRINVRRLMIYVRKVILLAAQRFVFEPNDEFTWAQIEGLLNPFLDDIRRRRGITQFRVVCDATVNTPVRIDRNELWTKVIIKPTKTAEILIFEINLTNQSADLGTL